MSTADAQRHLPCQTVVELLTDYLEGALDPTTCARVEHHLSLCPPCATYLDQLRTTMELVGRLPEDTLPADALQELDAAFRGFHPPPTGP